MGWAHSAWATRTGGFRRQHAILAGANATVTYVKLRAGQTERIDSEVLRN
jgi:hypothetical protein